MHWGENDVVSMNGQIECEGGGCNPKSEFGRKSAQYSPVYQVNWLALRRESKCVSAVYQKKTVLHLQQPIIGVVDLKSKG